MRIYKLRALRKIALPVLKALGRDMHVRHPWVKGARVRLHTFRHKGYWFHGQRREQASMALFGKLIPRGGSVVEVGGHIGYITLYLAQLAGSEGQVTVFEPGSNNLPYIRHNLLSNNTLATLAPINLVEKAVGAEMGEATFYEDSLTGQNNSLVADFDILKRNARDAYVKSDVKARTVKVTTLDGEFQSRTVDFIKIDVEGFEWGVLLGAAAMLERHKPYVMVEVQADNVSIFRFLTGLGYKLYSASGQELLAPEGLAFNVFCLHGEHHAAAITLDRVRRARQFAWLTCFCQRHITSVSHVSHEVYLFSSLASLIEFCDGGAVFAVIRFRRYEIRLAQAFQAHEL